MEEPAMYEQTAVKSGEHDSFETDVEHVMPPELPTQDSALEDSVRSALASAEQAR
jgi:hypothetical protein